jgi:copper(I)-binding protein
MVLAWALTGGLLGTAARSDQPVMDVQVTEAWIRWLPANLPAGGYMTVTNRGAATRQLLGASSLDYEEASVHQTRSNHGMNEMVPVDSVELKPQVPVHFAEGGYHLMLMRPKRPIHPGDRVVITLRFAQGRSIDVPFEVRAGNSN